MEVYFEKQQDTKNKQERSTGQMGKTVQWSAIAWTLHKAGLYGSVASHMKSWFKFANRCVRDSAYMWQRVLWSDETKTELFGLGTKPHFWQKANTAHQPENTIPTVKQDGGSIIRS